MIDLVSTFIAFFAVIDPIGTVPVFIAATRKHEPKSRPRIALLASLVAAGVLLFFIAAGEPILKAINVPLSAFQVAGGIVLFLFSLSMIFGDSKPEEEIKMLEANPSDTAIFPLAVPSIGGPGAMLASVLLTDNTRYSLFEQVQTALVMLSVVAVAYVLMRGSTLIDRLIGQTGASVISRVMGLILAAVATDNALTGIKLYFGLG